METSTLCCFLNNNTSTFFSTRILAYLHFKFDLLLINKKILLFLIKLIIIYYHYVTYGNLLLHKFTFSAYTKASVLRFIFL